MKTLRDIPNLRGVKVLVRTDFNVPIRNGAVADDFRIRTALPTIEYLTSRGAKVILVSHAESNDGKNNTLEPVSGYMVALGKKVTFVKNPKNAYETVEHLEEGGIILLENLRILSEGEKKNDKKFSADLASLADIYVNEAFPVSHRAHASTVGVPELLPSYAGLQFEQEVKQLSRAFNPSHPFVFILGGAKFETKMPLLERFLGVADTVFLGGALANDLLKAKGYEVGTSLLSGGGVDFRTLAESPKMIVPLDITNQDHEIKPTNMMLPTDKILDAGPQTIDYLREKILAAKFVLWNGPLGLYEQGFTGPTIDLAKIVSEATTRGAETIIGGGDTVAAVSTLGLHDKFTFISTGGGAMLDFLAKGTLPGIEALEKSHH
jgi:phosphoglycerate kinase